MKFTLLLALLLAACLVAACSTAPKVGMFEQFYQPNGGNGLMPPYSGISRIMRTDDPSREILQAEKSGAVLLGYSTYESSLPPDIMLLQQHARRIGADVVYYGGTATGTSVVTRPVLETLAVPPSTVQTVNVSVGGNAPVGPAFSPAQRTTETVARQVSTEVQFYQWQAVFLRTKKG